MSEVGALTVDLASKVLHAGEAEACKGNGIDKDVVDRMLRIPGVWDPAEIVHDGVEEEDSLDTNVRHSASYKVSGKAVSIRRMHTDTQDVEAEGDTEGEPT